MAKSKKTKPDAPEVVLLKQIKASVLKKWKPSNLSIGQVERLGNTIYNTGLAECIEVIDKKIKQLENTI